MTERERMLTGQLYNAADPELAAARLRAKELCRAFNDTATADSAGREAILRRLLGHMGANCWIEPSFRCDYGTNITIGDHFYANHNCIILDGAKVTFGHHVLLGPNCAFYTTGHPLDPQQRQSMLMYSYPITVGDNVWIGGNTVVMAGVTIGSDTVIGGGSVVTRDIPSGVVAAGNPCRVLRKITDADRIKYETNTREK